jgi:ABC-2 type transport system ATP-binding protein
VTAAITVDALTRRFGPFTAVDAVSFEVGRGEIFGYLGANGAGKSTTIKMLCGLLAPSSGDAIVAGRPISRDPEGVKARIGYMSQKFSLYPDLLVVENLEFFGGAYGLWGADLRRRIDSALDRVGLAGHGRDRTSALPGGMRQRVALAGAILHEPEIVFLDEPTAGVDPVLRQKFWEEFRRLRDDGRTILVTTQYVGEAEYCDTVAVLQQGRLIALATPEELRKQALGGETIEVETRRVVDGAALTGLDGVTAVRQDGPRNLFVTVQDAGDATPRVLEAIAAQGGEVLSSREYRPSFDDVFARLVTDDRVHAAEPGARRNGASP